MSNPRACYMCPEDLATEYLLPQLPVMCRGRSPRCIGPPARSFLVCMVLSFDRDTTLQSIDRRQLVAAFTDRWLVFETLKGLRLEASPSTYPSRQRVLPGGSTDAQTVEYRLIAPFFVLARRKCYDELASAMPQQHVTTLECIRDSHCMDGRDLYRARICHLYLHLSVLGHSH